MRAASVFLSSAVLLLAGPAFSETVIVDPSGAGDFTTIQAAIDASVDGDIILVKAGTHEGFLIDGRSLTVRGVGASLTSVEVVLQGGVRVQNLGVDQEVFLSRLRTLPTGLSGLVERPTIEVFDCAGAVRVEECETEHLSLLNSGNVALVEMTAPDFLDPNVFNIPGVGLLVSQSQSASFFSRYRGRPGSFCGRAEPGVEITGNSVFFDLEGEFFGGHGADYACGYLGSFEDGGGDGGHALQFGFGTFAPSRENITLQGTTLTPGQGGASFPSSGYCYYGTSQTCQGEDGIPVLPSSFALQQVREPARSAVFSNLVDEGDYLSVELSGMAGDEAVLVLSSSGDFLRVPGSTGVQLAGSSSSSGSFDRVISLGTLPSAQWTVPVAIPLEDSDFGGVTRFAQVIFSDANDELWFGEGRSLTIKDVEQFDTDRYFCFGGEVPGSACGVCPCNNIISEGNWGGCRNGNGTSCRLVASGEASLTSDTLSFGVTGAGTDTAALLNSADNRLPAMGACPVGSGIGMGSGMDGLRCVGGALLRHGVRGTDLQGSSVNPWGFGSPNPPGGILASAGFTVGQTRHFQVFYRDNFLLGCGTALNTSNGVSVTVAP